MKESYSDGLLDFLMAGIRGKDASEAFHWLRLRVRKLESKVEFMKCCANCSHLIDRNDGTFHCNVSGADMGFRDRCDGWSDDLLVR